MIGLIDSGVGGLSVLAAIEALLPSESCVYYGDLAHFPYGLRAPAEVTRFCSEATAFLLSKGIEILVIACHTATCAAYETLRKNFPIPVIGMVDPTIRAIPPGKTGLLATQGTIDTGVYQKAIPDLLCMPCPKLVESIEQGEKNLQPVIQRSIEPAIRTHIDALILGCTHLGFASHEIEEELDPATHLLNPAVAVASEVKKHISNPSTDTPTHTLFVTGHLESFRAFVEKHPPKAPYELFQLQE